MSIAGLIMVILVASVVAYQSASQDNWGWCLVSIATAFCAGLAIYFKLLGQI